MNGWEGQPCPFIVPSRDRRERCKLGADEPGTGLVAKNLSTHSSMGAATVIPGGSRLVREFRRGPHTCPYQVSSRQPQQTRGERRGGFKARNQLYCMTIALASVVIIHFAPAAASPTPIPTFPPSSATLLPTIGCPRGTYVDGSECVDCPIGRFSNGTDPRPRNCTLCAAGTYQPSTGQTHCRDCESGTVSSEDRSNCGSCPSGTYVKDDKECVSCAEGKCKLMSFTCARSRS